MPVASAVSEATPSFRAVNSTFVVVPCSRFCGSKSAPTPPRSAEMQRAPIIGGSRFMAMGKKLPLTALACENAIAKAPQRQRAAAASSRSPGFSLLMMRAKSRTQMSSVAPRRTCVPLSTSAMPQLVRAYLTPKAKPAGAAQRSLKRRWGPSSQERREAAPDAKCVTTFSTPRHTAAKPSCRKAAVQGYGKALTPSLPLKTSLA
mmetsp:Transcript_66946/g.215812  ORF Transcript_66946/g.215812 Transcript_66946/m.215812 type:complete len:204 (-) Transcript_66946:110-721(-)